MANVKDQQFRFWASLALFMLLPHSLFATLPAIGNDSLFICLEEEFQSECYGSIHRVTSSGVVPVSLRQARIQINRRINNTKRRLGLGRSSRLESRLSNLLETRKDLSACNRYYSPQCSDQEDPGHPSLACSVAGDSDTSFDQKSDDVTSRIVNGLVCERGDSPVLPIRESGQTVCTGTLIASNVVLTAAHCLNGSFCQSLSVRDSTGQTSVASSCKLHPEYNPTDDITERNDIALIFLESSPLARIAPIHIEDDFIAGESLVLAGFGRNESGNYKDLRAASNVLQSVSSFGLVARYDVGDSSGTTCNGDSGGPLFVLRDSTWHVAGVTSWGSANNCALPGFESGDTAVWSKLSAQSHLNFIATWVPSLFR
jgi:hypothetical protein